MYSIYKLKQSKRNVVFNINSNQGSFFQYFFGNSLIYKNLSIPSINSSNTTLQIYNINNNIQISNNVFTNDSINVGNYIITEDTSLNDLSEVHIGLDAGKNNQGAYCVAIGENTATNNQDLNTIVMNSTGKSFETYGITDAFYVKNINETAILNNNVLNYNINNKEITYKSNNINKNIIIKDSGDISNLFSFENGVLTNYSNQIFMFEVDTSIINLFSNSTSQEQFKLPLVSTGNYNFLVDWGDGTRDYITSFNQPEITHTYAIPNIYTISILGTCEGWVFNNQGDCQKILDIKNWGSGFKLGTNEGNYFYGCINMNISALDLLNLTKTTSLLGCFRDCVKMNSTNLTNWDTSNVSDMSGMFDGAKLFNQPIGNWNTANISDMNSMFKGATLFNQYIGDWDVSNVTNISKMFLSASAFNQELTNWDVSKVTTMLETFNYSGFNNGDTLGLSNKPLNWNTGNVTTMVRTFSFCPFNQYIGDWDTSSVTTLASMFLFNSNFNNGDMEGISSKPLNWNTSLVTDMSSVFDNTKKFNQNISSWNVSKTTKFDFMFAGAIFFNQNIGNWDTSSAVSMFRMFIGCTEFNNGDLKGESTKPLKWNTSRVLNMGTVFYNCASFNQNISYDPINNYWDTSNVTDMAGTFRGCIVFNNGDVPGGSDKPLNWNTSKVLSMSGLFWAAFVYNQPLNNWDVSNVKSMSFMFLETKLFNQPINSWNVSNVINMSNMFQGAIKFNQALISWNVSSVTDMSNMFLGATDFNGDINGWILSAIINMSNMFFGATKFNKFIGDWIINDTLGKNINMSLMFRNAYMFNNGELPGLSTKTLNWNTSNVVDMSRMFENARSFNQSINSWNTIKVSNMYNMFYGATLFNQNIGGWNTSSVTNMNRMFFQLNYNLASFNNGGSDTIKNWDTSNVTNMTGMFYNTPFNQPVNLWITSKVTLMSSMFGGALNFNNGQVSNIEGINLSKSTYTNSTKILFCPGASFLTQLKIGNVLWITSNIQYIGIVKLIIDDESLELVTALGVNITEGNIFNIQNTTIDNFTPSNSTYTDNTKTLFCPDASFLTTFLTGDTVWIVANTGTYINTVQDILDNENLILTTFLNLDLTAGNIYNVQKPNIGKYIFNWDTSKVTDMSNMFLGARLFNQNISGFNMSMNEDISSMFSGALSFNNGNLINTSSTPLTWTNTSKIKNMSSVFNNARSFNQDIGSWSTSNVNTMASMFQNAVLYNNCNSDAIKNWSAPLCSSFVSMFQGATSFNQPLSNLVNTTDVASCLMTSMFSGATLFNQNISGWKTDKVTNMSNMFLGSTSIPSTTKFNNGELGLQLIPSIIPANSFYINNTRELNCPNATFLTSLTDNDVLVITTTSLVYSSKIESISSDSKLVLATAYGSNISSPSIISIQKQIPGTSPLNWNTSNVTTMNSMFRYCPYFNQKLTTTDNIWNVNKVVDVSNIFGGVATSMITLFNNGEIITGTGNQLNWIFNVLPTNAGWKTFCKLTPANAITTPQLN